MLWTGVALLLTMLPALIKSGRGPYSFFFRVVSQASIKAWWHTCPVTLWVAQTKVQNYIKEWWKKKCVWLEQFWLAFFPPFKAAALFLHHLFFRQRQQNVFEKCHILIMHDAYEALAPASPFFLPKATKCFPKNATSWCVLSCFLGMATECSTSQKTEPAIIS